MIRDGNLRTRQDSPKKERQVHKVLAARYEVVLNYRYLQHFAHWGGKIEHFIYNSFHKANGLFLIRKFQPVVLLFVLHLECETE